MCVMCVEYLHKLKDFVLFYVFIFFISLFFFFYFFVCLLVVFVCLLVFLCLFVWFVWFTKVSVNKFASAFFQLPFVVKDSDTMERHQELIQKAMVQLASLAFIPANLHKDTTRRSQTQVVSSALVKAV